MIDVVFKTPQLLRSTTAYSETGKSNVQISATLVGRPEMRYAFHRKCGHMIASLEALKDLECTSRVRIAITRGLYYVEGDIGVWQHSLLAVARAVATEIEFLAQQVCNEYAECEMTIEFSLTRKILNAA